MKLIVCSMPIIHMKLPNNDALRLKQQIQKQGSVWLTFNKKKHRGGIERATNVQVPTDLLRYGGIHSIVHTPLLFCYVCIWNANLNYNSSSPFIMKKHYPKSIIIHKKDIWEKKEKITPRRTYISLPPLFCSKQSCPLGWWLRFLAICYMPIWKKSQKNIAIKTRYWFEI